MFKSVFSNLKVQEFLRTSFGNILEWYDFSIYGLLAIPLAQAFSQVSTNLLAYY